MTQTFTDFNKTCSQREHYLSEELRLQSERFKSNSESQQMAQQQGYSQAEQHDPLYKPSSSSLRAINRSAAPTLYAYGKQKALAHTLTETEKKQRGFAPVAIERITGKRDAVRADIVKQKKEDKLPHYHERFHPNQEYIYVPPGNVHKQISMQKSMLGQTSVIPALAQSCETLWRENFLKSQTMNDLNSNNKADAGLLPICNVFKATGEDGQEFTIDYKAKAKEDIPGAYITKHLTREACVHEPKEKFLASTKLRSFEETGPMRPYQGGTTLTRKIKSDDISDMSIVKELRYDTRTTNRQFHDDIPQEMLKIAHDEQAAGHARWMADRRKPNPVGTGFPQPLITVNEYQRKYLNESECARKCCEDSRLIEHCADMAQLMYGGERQAVKDWVGTLSKDQQKQLAFLGEEAERRNQNDDWKE
ncbi:hypothetical protein SS50377_21813 [Spironucleus salmonicida]|uniref:Uncharacterized protein n=1 Tax=Spironucleus salmonicida TaxID=348837 RepID=V6LVG6_9EUKA|nr:hypothetical protein SS50377_21813 [Spironucleus salmonicida]|eukprot:EST44799.1 hypothetical protein SS50377_15308 [Spironucleus salmonicida]